MEAAHNAVGGAGLVVLDEIYFGYLLIKFSLGEGLEEIASGVFEDSGFDYYWAFYVGFDYVHGDKVFNVFKVLNVFKVYMQPLKQYDSLIEFLNIFFGYSHQVLTILPQAKARG